MDENQKYAVILMEIGELLQKKNTYIEIRDFENERLKQQLAMAEEQIQELKKGNTK